MFLWASKHEGSGCLSCKTFGLDGWTKGSSDATVGGVKLLVKQDIIWTLISRRHKSQAISLPPCPAVGQVKLVKETSGTLVNQRMSLLSQYWFLTIVWKKYIVTIFNTRVWFTHMLALCFQRKHWHIQCIFHEGHKQQDAQSSNKIFDWFRIEWNFR